MDLTIKVIAVMPKILSLVAESWVRVRISIDPNSLSLNGGNMCVTCGCSEEAETVLTHFPVQTTASIHEHQHTLPDGTVISHSHAH